MTDNQRSHKQPDSTVFVFAGGGSLGAIQVGMLKALTARGIMAEAVVGSSVGAINAAYFASNPTVEGVRQMEILWRGIKRQSVFPVSVVTFLQALIWERNFLVDSKSLRGLIEQNLPIDNLEQGRIPCHVVATDLLEGLEVVLSSGPVGNALLASSAIPGIFPPQEINGRLLIDGGVANHTPVSVAVELGFNRVIVLPTGYSCAPRKPPQGVIGLALHALNQMIVRQLMTDLKRLAFRAKIRVVPPLCPLQVSSYDFTRAEDLIDRAETTTGQWIDQGGLEKVAIPHELPLHRHR